MNSTTQSVIVADSPQTPPSPAQGTREAAQAIDRSRALALFLFGAIGFLSAVVLLLSTRSHALTTPVAAAAVLMFAVSLLAGWVVSVLLLGISNLMRILADQIEATDRIAQHLVAVGDPFAQDRAADPDEKARRTAAQELLAKIDAARTVNDPERVIELRDALQPLLDPDALRATDRDLAKWFVGILFRRSRAGTIRADVARLAGQVAARFDGTPEGASVRASLPTLRRAAGLCALCGQPYLGIENACPICLAGAPLSVPPSAPTSPSAKFTPTPPSSGPEAETPGD